MLAQHFNSLVLMFLYWDPTECALLYLDCVLVWPDDCCIATETCRHSQYRNSSVIYVLLCFR